jgi:uncharacterized protein
MASLARDDSVTTEAVWFYSGKYRLEGELTYPDGVAVGAVVIAGPHPFLGGSMQNNVVCGLADGLPRRGVALLKFNYRGVGNSDGPSADVTADLIEFLATSHSADEATYRDDLASAGAYLRESLDQSMPLALIGYSFGCSLLSSTVDRHDIPLALIAPTIGTHEYTAFENLPNPILLVAPDADFAAEANQTRQWFDRLQGPKRLVHGGFDGHFFRGFEERLAAEVFGFLDGAWEAVA